MLDGWHDGQRVGSGTVIWHARNLMAAGKLDYEGFMTLATASSPSIGHCNTMGTALSMNSLAEALGMSLPTCASIPAPYRERGQMAYATGKRICDMVREDMRPSRILTREAFENAIVVASALGASSNCPPHLIAMARHAGIDLSLDDWQRLGEDVPLLANCVPAGEHLGEGFHRAGGVPAVLHELQAAGRLHDGCLTVSGQTIGEIAAAAKTRDPDVIRSCARRSSTAPASSCCRAISSTVRSSRCRWWARPSAAPTCPSPATRTPSRRAPSCSTAPRTITRASRIRR